MTEPRKITQPFAEFQQVQETVSAADPATAARTAAELRAAQEEEWGRFVAAERIYSESGALAFLPGHAVPQSSVSDNGPVYPGQVALRPRPERAAAAQPTQSAAPQAEDATPAGNASTEEWRAYAVAHGVPEEESMTLGREEIKARLEEGGTA